MTRALAGIGQCEITLEVYKEGDRLICGIFLIEGTINAKPKAWLQIVRSELRTLETIAREAGCEEVRMPGRFTTNIFPDYAPYEPSSGLPGLRKDL